MKWIGWSAVLVGYAWLAASTLVGEHGLLHLLKLQQEQSEVHAKVFALLNENEKLRSRLAQLQTDDEFLEQVVRETLRFAKKGEVIYFFQKAPETPVP